MERDIIIVGGGPAGLTAAIYCSRANLKTVVLEEQSIGGQIVFTTDIENYPGFPDGVIGPELGSLIEKQAKRFGAEISYETLKQIDVDKKRVHTDKNVYSCKALILAMGAAPMKLNIEKEAELTGRGISYCATCDGAFFRDQVVAVVGGGNTAIEEALFLTNFAKTVYIIHRRDKFRAEKYLQSKALNHQKIKPLWNCVVKEIIGEDSLEGVIVNNVVTGKEERINLNGLFIFVGYKPRTDLVKDVVRLDKDGYILTDEYAATNVPWIFAAGDCRKKPYKQIATAVGDGCTAAMSAIAYTER